MKGQSEYDKQATDFLTRFGLELSINESRYQTEPDWSNESAHGIKYDIQIKRTNHKGQSIEFPFWDSIRNKEIGTTPTEYDILACISSDATHSTDPDEIYEEYGEMKPSQAIAIGEFAKRLQAFFSSDELKSLSDIQ